MKYQFEQFDLEYKKSVGSQEKDMSKNIWSDLLADQECFLVPRELKLRRKDLGLNNQEYILLLDYLDCLSRGETEDLNKVLAELNGVSEETIEKRLGAIEKKGILRKEIETDGGGKIRGIIFSPAPLIKKLESFANSDSLIKRSKEVNRACESESDYKAQSEVKEKKWKDEFCSTRWYNDVFSEMYEEVSGQPVLTGGREFKSADTYFRRLKQLNPNLDAEALFVRATEGACFMLDSQLRGGVFGWLHKPPDICMLANQAQAVDYQLRCIEKIYGERELTNQESDICNVEILLKEKVKEKENEQIERLYGELREFEQEDVRRDFQESLQKRLSGNRS